MGGDPHRTQGEFDRFGAEGLGAGRVTDLPILAVLPDLLAALRGGTRAVLVAPPGAGKTTAVAPALIGEDWCAGEVLLLSPRRLAARAAAERMAALADEPVGRTFGYATRMDSRRSAATRVTVVTEGIFVARIQADPELAGVSAVLFDEVHERSLDGDFGLALALDAQAGFRPDLRIVAMSATLDGARFSALMDGCPVIESEGRGYPLTLRHVGRDPAMRIEEAVARACRTALAEQEGGVLAFLPGVAEIERTAERLEERLPDGVRLHRLHGSLDPGAQRAAIRPEPGGQRKLVLATAIAETSLTLDGIRAVVDSGLARRARYDRAAGVTRLVTERVSQAAATQRAGRAGRQGPGVAYRLWEAAATAGLPPFDPPEILEADLSALVLACAIWGAEPRSLRWLDPPPAAAVEEARARLLTLGAIDEGGRPTAHGRRIAELPMAPRLAHMLILAPDKPLAAELAVLLGERGLGGDVPDLEARLGRWRGERGAKAEAARGLAKRWAGLVRGARGDGPPPAPPASGRGVGETLALAFPDRVARRRDSTGEHWASVGGRGFRLDPATPLARSEWLAVAETQGSAAGARILSAAAIDAAAVEALFADRIATVRQVRFDPATGGVQATRERRLGAVRLSSGPDASADPEAIAAALVEGVRAHGIDRLPWSDAARALMQRAEYAGVAIDLVERLDEWLPPLLAGRRRLEHVTWLTEALQGLIGWDAMRRIDRLAPSHFTSPAGSSHPIDYAAEGGPRVELRPQALFGLAEHPTIGEARVPLVLSLTSPAGRPIQTTRDLPGFWAGTWAAVAKEMRGRYPRHPWPDDPAAAAATLRTKNADARGAR